MCGFQVSGGIFYFAATCTTLDDSFSFSPLAELGLLLRSAIAPNTHVHKGTEQLEWHSRWYAKWSARAWFHTLIDPPRSIGAIGDGVGAATERECLSHFFIATRFLLNLQPLLHSGELILQPFLHESGSPVMTPSPICRRHDNGHPPDLTHPPVTDDTILLHEEWVYDSFRVASRVSFTPKQRGQRFRSAQTTRSCNTPFLLSGIYNFRPSYFAGWVRGGATSITRNSDINFSRLTIIYDAGPVSVCVRQLDCSAGQRVPIPWPTRWRFAPVAVSVGRLECLRASAG